MWELGLCLFRVGEVIYSWISTKAWLETFKPFKKLVKEKESGWSKYTHNSEKIRILTALDYLVIWRQTGIRISSFALDAPVI